MIPVTITYYVAGSNDEWTLHYFASPKQARMQSSCVSPSWGRNLYRKAAELAREAAARGSSVSGWLEGYGQLTATL